MVNKSTVRSALSLIVIFGHLLVFVYGIILGVFSLLQGDEAIQVILMASPVLATTAFSAFSNVLASENVPASTDIVSRLYAVLVIAFPLMLITLIVALFTMFAMQLDNFGPIQLKICLGAVETFFGGYLGLISKSLFENPAAPSAKRRRAQSSAH